MNLNPEEYELIRQRMLEFKITYQEIYHEIFDHVASDVETKRSQGDNRPIPAILEELITINLGGADGIKKMAREHEKLFRLKIHRMVLKAYGRSIWWKTLIVVAFAVVIDQLIPDNQFYTLGLYGAGLLMLLVTEALAIIKMRAIPVTDNKQSLLKTNMIWHICLPMTMFNIAITVPNLISTLMQNKSIGLFRLHPIIPIIIIGYSALYTASCFRVMRKEMEAVKA